MIQKCITVLLLLLLLQEVQGQDLHFSQFMYSPLNGNAANAGFFDGDLRAGALHRRQWGSITVPYKTFSVAADAGMNLFTDKLPGVGAGILINHDQAGDGQLTNLDVRLHLSYRLSLTEDSVHFIRGGIMGGFTQRNINFNELTFDEQFDGDAWDPLAPNGESFARNTTSWMDLGAGIGWDMINERSRWQAGISATHLNRPNQSFYNTPVKRPVLWQFNLASAIAINETFTLAPAAVFMLQEKFTQLNFGAEGRIQMQEEKNKKYAIGLGLHYRLQDALIPSVALYWSKFRFGFSYDINISGLRQVSNGRGGPEFSLTYITRKIKARPQRSVICPVY
jgi:type IX secretion system PorP/SprF family membrane protein